MPIGLVKGVLFDKDGTLSNSEKYLQNLAYARIKKAKHIYNQNLESEEVLENLEKLLSISYGITSQGQIQPEGLIAIGSRENNLIATAAIFSLLGKNWAESLETATEIFSVDDAQQNSQVLPGAKKVLQSLNKARVQCAIISNDSSKGIQTFLKANSLAHYFSKIWSSENLPSKPNPKAIDLLCKSLGLKPEECALIGDADTDLQMAQKAGIKIRLGYIAGWSKQPQLTRQTKILHHWDDLKIDLETKVLDEKGSP